MSAQPIPNDTVVQYEQPEKVTRDGYPYKGQVLPRVTAILGTAPGQHLLSWYAKMGAIEAASHLLMAGLWEPSTEEANPDHLVLHDVIESRGKRHVEAATAFAGVIDWKDNMRAPERYRDSRARIGSVVHHARYDHAMGLRVKPNDLLDYLTGLAKRVNAKRDYESWIARELDYGKTIEQLELALAHESMPGTLKLFQFIEDFQPEPLMVGQEAMVVNEPECYAGTLDDISTYQCKHWEKHQAWPKEWAGMGQATLVDDLKTSKALDPKVPFQLAAYSFAEAIVLDDGSEFPVPDHDGIAAIHVKHDGKVTIKVWPKNQVDKNGKEFDAIERFYDGFCGLNVFYRCLHDMPKATRIRKAAKPKAPTRTDYRKVAW